MNYRYLITFEHMGRDGRTHHNGATADISRATPIRGAGDLSGVARDLARATGFKHLTVTGFREL